MSKTARSHFVASLQVRALILDRSANVSGEQDVAVATSRSSIYLPDVQIRAQQKGGS